MRTGGARHWAAGLVLALLAHVALAQTDLATAEQLLRKSGLWVQMATVADTLRDTMVSGPQGVGAGATPSEVARLQVLAAQAYQPQRMQETARALVAQRLNPDDLAALNAWYDAPLGQQVNQMEVDAGAGSSEAQRARGLAGADLFQTLAPPRKLLLRDMVIALRALDMNVSLVQASSWALYQGLRGSDANPPPGVPGEDEMRARLDAQRPGLRLAFAPLLLSGMAQTYAALSDDELQRYIDFLRSPSGRAYTDLQIQAVGTALVEGAAALGRGLRGVKDGANT
ncbi:MAG: hypothetical protein RJA98_1927 [Pseudomonadota bacterium]|jgi:hypothetical protein